ncbi:nuclear hormone receptor HR96-like [Oppia nitens]|uniref:nuclear hormone receptor HR96-like n=1 Tax=Oppia nitens TaxID=1686743 RepID=UPI0023DADBB7|nr:nuclear hormone receptor HR96-like [Oppia nitens]
MIRVCCVCGDRAIGTNFGAITCESCKAFFRRTAVKNKDFKCPFDNNCQINSVTRKFCQKCRLNKCYAQGMKRESILNEKERQLIRLKIEENRRKRKVNEESIMTRMETSDNSLPDSTVYMTPNLSDKYGKQVSVKTCNSLSKSVYDINEEIKDIESYINIENKESDISEEVYQTAIDLQFSMIAIMRPLSDYYNNFNELEGSKMNELFAAVNNIREPKPNRLVSEVTDIYNLQTSAITLRFQRQVANLTKFTKNLTGFREICEDDQIALVKYGCVEMLNMRSILFYDSENDLWDVPLDNQICSRLRTGVLMAKPKVYQKIKKYLDQMSMEWDGDKIIVDLMTAILLFNPNRPDVTHKDVVKFHQKAYMYLLQRYLILRYRSNNETKSKFLRLINIVRDVNSMGKVMREDAANNDHTGMPLLEEVFETGPHSHKSCNEQPVYTVLC